MWNLSAAMLSRSHGEHDTIHKSWVETHGRHCHQSCKLRTQQEQETIGLTSTSIGPPHGDGRDRGFFQQRAANSNGPYPYFFRICIQAALNHGKKENIEMDSLYGVLDPGNLCIPLGQRPGRPQATRRSRSRSCSNSTDSRYLRENIFPDHMANS